MQNFRWVRLAIRIPLPRLFSIQAEEGEETHHVAIIFPLRIIDQRPRPGSMQKNRIQTPLAPPPHPLQERIHNPQIIRNRSLDHHVKVLRQTTQHLMIA